MEANMVDLRKGVGEWIEYLRPAASSAEKYIWSGADEDQYWEFVKRSVIRRQFEALETILQMFDAKHGHFSVLLLRPAYEELIWTAYLVKHAYVAPELVRLLAVHEIADSLNAQNEYTGLKTMAKLGFSQRYVKTVVARDRSHQTRIKEIGRSLKWPQRPSLLPSMAYLSRQVKYEREYKFLYHATSRYVHFSVHELGRRVWGESGEVSIGSTRFSDYWAHFGMYWAFWLFIHTAVECHDALGDVGGGPEKEKEMEEQLRAFEPIPILTMEELRAWTPRSSAA
jgi:hypothetical protein